MRLAKENVEKGIDHIGMCVCSWFLHLFKIGSLNKMNTCEVHTVNETEACVINGQEGTRLVIKYYIQQAKLVTNRPKCVYL